jgi:hypothetical protein
MSHGYCTNSLSNLIEDFAVSTLTPPSEHPPHSAVSKLTSGNKRANLKSQASISTTSMLFEQYLTLFWREKS